MHRAGILEHRGGSVRIIKSPWGATFDEFVESIRESAIIVAPFIAQGPVERLARRLGSRRWSVRLEVMTSLKEDSLIDGATDAAALAWLCDRAPGTTVRHLGNLHAKAYIADGHTAIVSSANLTDGGLRRNLELGVAITNPATVREIADDLRAYSSLGILIPPDALVELDNMAQKARRNRAAIDRETPDGLKSERQSIRSEMRERLVQLGVAGDGFSVNPDASLQAQFTQAILYVLRRYGPTSTRDMHPIIQQLKPEICDDEIDLIINGMNFGRNWHHKVRNAQVGLRRNGVIAKEKGRNQPWRLVGTLADLL